RNRCRHTWDRPHMTIDTVTGPAVEKREDEVQLSREALYELVWSQPMLKVATRCGVSSSYMARICTLLNVPRPERGYWAKLAVGKAPAAPALPEARPGDQLAWSPGAGTVTAVRPLPRAPTAARKRWSKPTTPRLDEHPLVMGAKALFE